MSHPPHIESLGDNLERLKSDFKFRVQELENQIDELQNLYVSSTQLLSAFDPAEVLAVVKEVLLNMVGAHSFEIHLVENDKKLAKIVEGEDPKVLGEEMTEQWRQFCDEVIRSGETLYVNMPGLVVVMPLFVGANVGGVLSIFTLLNQKKEGLSSRDLQMLDLLARHAGGALVCAALYRRHTSAMADFLAEIVQA